MRSWFFLGDSHGDLAFVECAAMRAREHAAELVSVGDWGFLWPGHDQLQELSDMLVGLGVTHRFIDGNHDDHPRLRKFVRRNIAVTIAPNVIYQPRGSVHQDEDGTRLLFLGGAPSIDRASRTPGRSWWPEETITDEEASRARAAKKPIHVLITHDAPSFPPGFSPKGSPGYQREQKLSMDRINMLVKHHRPQLNVHGHWHRKYERLHDCGTHIVGLDCNFVDPARLNDSALLWTRKDEP